MLSEDLATACRALVAAHAHAPLSTRVTAGRRTVVTIADGYVPLLVDYTEEDREAKGLRKLQAAPGARPAVHDTVLEAMVREPLLLLTGASGCGKSTSLLHLALHLAGAAIDDAVWSLAALTRPVARNDSGAVRVESWSGRAVVPLLIVVEEPCSLMQLIAAQAAVMNAHAGDCLLLIDRGERLGASGPRFLEDAMAFADGRPGLRIVVAGDADVCRAWTVPTAFTRRRIVPLVEAQRSAIEAIVRPDGDFRVDRAADADLLGNAGLFTLAAELGGAATSSIAVVDHWLDVAARRNALDVETLIRIGTRTAEAPQAEVDGRQPLAPGDLRLLQRPFLQRQLAARHLAGATLDFVASLYRAAPLEWSSAVALAARRLVEAGRQVEPLLLALMEGDDDAALIGAVDAACIAGNLPDDAVGTDVRDAIRSALRTIVEHGRLPVALRAEAGRALAVDGDPRSTEALIDIPAGPFTMGSSAHPNSAPQHPVTVGAYRIGRYPVTNRSYRHFIEETGRHWPSSDGLLPARSNAPAVDLSWHDARAYCAWLGAQWRASGRIAVHAIVRLPTEAEWERAARGLRDDDGLVYPWTGSWQPDSANSEETGFNDTCTVGLFPRGRSPDGCDDMAGQVWEWTSTLWGEDMATPRFAYPYVDDGREDPDAPADVRRVLRGACFLSPRDKANCIYRGSLEPAGSWRGNGFRLVVAESPG